MTDVGQAPAPRTPSSPRRRRSPRSIPEFAVAIVERILGRELNGSQGCVVQVVAVALFIALFAAFIQSGLLFDIIKTFADWYASLFMDKLVPKPSGG